MPVDTAAEGARLPDVVSGGLDEKLASPRAGSFRLDVIVAAIIGAPIKRLVLLAAMIFDVNNKNKQS